MNMGPDNQNAGIEHFTIVADKLFFVAADRDEDRELWAYDLSQPITWSSHFKNCAWGTDNNARIIIPTDAVLEHDDGIFMPEKGDEIAIYRPEETTVSVCAGATTLNPYNDFSSLLVWGEDYHIEGPRGILPGEVMAWRIWDRSADKEYRVNVTYSGVSPMSLVDGEYQPGTEYMVERFQPTAVKIVSMDVRLNNVVPWLGLALFVLLNAFLAGAFVSSWRS